MELKVCQILVQLVFGLIVTTMVRSKATSVPSITSTEIPPNVLQEIQTRLHKDCSANGSDRPVGSTQIALAQISRPGDQQIKDLADEIIREVQTLREEYRKERVTSEHESETISLFELDTHLHTHRQNQQMKVSVAQHAVSSLVEWYVRIHAQEQNHDERFVQDFVTEFLRIRQLLRQLSCKLASVLHSSVSRDHSGFIAGQSLAVNDELPPGNAARLARFRRDFYILEQTESILNSVIRVISGLSSETE